MFISKERHGKIHIPGNKHTRNTVGVLLSLQAVLDSIKENDFHGTFEAWKNDGIAVYIPKETILKEMAAKIEYIKPAFLF
jgi:hypothetical protein